MHCRYKGKLTEKNIAQWKKNVIASNKARNENKENAENTNFIGNYGFTINLRLYIYQCVSLL